MPAGRSSDCSQVVVAEQEPRFERNPAALCRRLVDGVLVLGPSADEPLRISTPGDAVWDLLAEPLAPGALEEDLSQIFNVPVDVVRADIDPVLRALMVIGAIRPVAGPG
jgi:hypothetical protein